MRKNRGLPLRFARKASRDAILVETRVAAAGYAVCAALTAAMAIGLAVLFAGCATAPHALARDPFSILGDGAALYVAFPVAENRELAGLLAESVAPYGGAGKAIERTQRAYVAIYPDGAMRLVAQGSYPRSAAPLIFPSSKGWKKITAGGATWYRRDSVDAALPQSGLALIAAKSDMAAMIAALKAPAGGTSVGSVSSSSLTGSGFPEFVSADLASGSGAIHVYVADASPLIGSVLGPDLSLPVDHATVRAIPVRSGAEALSSQYRVSITVSARDARTEKAMASIVRLAFPDSKPAVLGTDIAIPEFSMSAEKLVDFAKNLYFYQ